jgi:hypothetical protein
MKHNDYQKSERYMHYRETLLTNGFFEAKQYCGRFFRQTNEQTAFILNLTDDDSCISVLYGFMAIPNMGDNGEWFADNGSDEDTCHVRNLLCIWDDGSEADACNTILNFYNQYKDFSKEAILNVKKERQKVFLSHFAVVLKPLGFKKKGARWTKDLGNWKALSFEAQKSAYSDQYYFNVSVHSVSNFFACQSYERVVMYGRDIYNWQLMTEEQIENLVQYALKQYIIPKLN